MTSLVAGLVGCGVGDPTAPPGRPPRPRPPEPVREVDPVGDLTGLDAATRRCFTDTRGFEPLPPPAAGSWRVLRPEPAQDVAQYLATRPNVPAPPRDRIVLMPLGHFPFDVIADEDFVGLVRAPELLAVARFVEATFGLATEVLPAAPLPEELPTRVHRRARQTSALALIEHVGARLPAQAYGVLALVTVDLFVWPEQQFAFGYSTFTERIGVAGFARFDPSYHGGPAPIDLAGTVLRRSLRVVAHEVAHLFGLAHCQYYRCLCNGVADLAELDALPPWLCPVCLCKLQRATGLDPIVQHRAVLRAFESLDLFDEAGWMRDRLARIGVAA